jgi:glutamine amidotransferase
MLPSTKGLSMIAIVDYGAGNLNSVKKAFDYLGAKVVVTDQSEIVAAADKIVFPGVGHFSSLRALDRSGLREALLQDTSSKKPFLGICLGMQWLFEGSEECSEVAGAGIFNGRCRRFPPSVKSPHVGWNSLTVQEGSRLLRGIAADSFVYYTHSFYAPVVATTSAATRIRATVCRRRRADNIFGVQFHPEKSGDVGLAILKNFCEV